MQDQKQRDEKSVHIFTGLLLCGLIAVVGLVLLWVADEFFGVPDDLGGGLSLAVMGGAVAAAIVYVYRHRRA